MNATQPAPVYIPSVIQRVGLINRSLPTDKNKKLDDIDKILSAEGKNMDKEGGEAAVSALYSELSVNGRFSSVTLIENANIKSPGLGVFPAPLTWETVEQLCKKNNVDALFELSYYDTETKVTYKATPIEIANPFGLTIPAIEHEAHINTLIKTGWRIYDPINKLIRDEYFINEVVNTFGKGINPLKAVEAIMGRKEAVLQSSTTIGINYSTRVLPYTIRVSRDYYVRGTDKFKTAKRRAQTGNWDGAAELWNEEVDNPKRKIAGRATYNMAIINEINGDLNKAIEWASISYTDYKNKLALSYINTLKRRIAKNNQLNSN